MISSEMELIPLTPQKHDPAWKHCQMFKEGDKVQLKCLYCLKIFKGGGIHRIKGHLACLKGNAATCMRVPTHVRLEMRESLEGLAGKRRKKESQEKVYVEPPEPLDRIDPVRHVLDQLGADEPDFRTPDPNSGFTFDHTTTSVTGEKRKRAKGKSPFPEPNSITVVNATALNINNTGFADKKVVEHLHIAIGKFLYHIGAPLDAVNSAYFQPMVEALVSAGAGAIAPSCHDLRGWVLKNCVEEVKNDVHKIMSTWNKTGCSIILEQCDTQMSKTLLNVLVYCPQGTVFLKSVDASAIITSSESLYELLKQVVEEVGERNVVQVITNSEEQYVAAGRRLTEAFPNLYWSPCAAHCVDLILEDFAKIEWINATIEQAKSVTRFAYNHSVVLNMMRRFTYGNDILEPGLTRSGTGFSTLKRMVDLKHNLESMVTSQDWMDCSFSKNPGGLEMLDVISNPSFWSSCDLIIRLTNPLLRVLRIIKSDKRPSLGYVYAGMYRAKETIKKELIKREDYMLYWNIIDQWWEQQWLNPLHAGGFYLNPKFFYSVEGDISKILSAMFDCIEKLVPDIKVQDKISKEIILYKNGEGDFGRKMAVRAKDTLLPAEWWSTYGASCPNLARLAVRILSQTCGSTGFRQNQIRFAQLHDKTNSLERQRVNDLVFVQNNLLLRKMHDKNKERNSIDPIAHDCAGLLEDWIMCVQDYGSSDWTTLELPSGNPVPLGDESDEFEELGAGFDEEEIFNRGKEGEDEV